MSPWLLFSLGLLAVLTSHGAARPDWNVLHARPEAWFATPDAARIIDAVLRHQAPAGDWPKNLDTTAPPFPADPSRLRGTFDNNATVHEVRFLARAVRFTRRTEAREAVERALEHILRAQYPHGGWPQSYPPGDGYARHITFNDGTHVNLAQLVRDAAHAPDFAFLSEDQRRRCGTAFDRAIDVLLRCQIRLAGRLTVWCAQHDEVTFEPRAARRFEPASLSGGESAGILTFLMSLDDPSPAVIEAVRAGVDWFATARLTGIRIVSRDGDRVVVPDPDAPPLWARFYDLQTQRPIFAGRDGVVRDHLADIEQERRTGYAWYGDWGSRVARLYARWPHRPAGP